MSLLGLDVGTTNVKGAAYSANGQVLASAEREYPTLRPRSGWVEIDARSVMEAARLVVREIAAKTANDPVEAMAVSAFGETVTPVSADRQILGNSILAIADTRGGEYIDSLVDKIGLEALYRINPNIPGINYSLPKMLWLREHEPEQYRRTDKFLLFGELLFYLLGMDAETSYSHANRTMLFDLKHECWSDQLLKATGFDAAKLPAVVPSGKVSGRLSAKAAAELGLQAGVLCVVGAHDQCCNALGAGVNRPGRAVCGIGTVECVAPVYDGIPDMGMMRGLGLNIEHHILPGQYMSFIYNQAGSLFKWFRDTFAAAERPFNADDVDIFTALTAEMPREPTRMLVLPYFERTGAPGFIGDVSGVIAGLTMPTKRGDILKAIMEGETYYFLDSLATLRSLGIDTSHFVATGGGSKSDAWLQIKADIFGVTYERCAVTEAGTLGAAMIAATAAGIVASYDEAVDLFVKPGQIFEPDARRHAFYQEKYQYYRELYPRLKDVLAWTARTV